MSSRSEVDGEEWTIGLPFLSIAARTTPGMPLEPLVVASSTIESKLAILIVLKFSRVN